MPNLLSPLQRLRALRHHDKQAAEFLSTIGDDKAALIAANANGTISSIVTAASHRVAQRGAVQRNRGKQAPTVIQIYASYLRAQRGT